MTIDVNWHQSIAINRLISVIDGQSIVIGSQYLPIAHHQTVPMTSIRIDLTLILNLIYLGNWQVSSVLTCDFWLVIDCQKSIDVNRLIDIEWYQLKPMMDYDQSQMPGWSVLILSECHRDCALWIAVLSWRELLDRWDNLITTMIRPTKQYRRRDKWQNNKNQM